MCMQSSFSFTQLESNRYKSLYVSHPTKYQTIVSRVILMHTQSILAQKIVIFIKSIDRKGQLRICRRYPLWYTSEKANLSIIYRVNHGVTFKLNWFDWYTNRTAPSSDDRQFTSIDLIFG